MATYATDLTDLTDAESGTWTEFASPYNAGGTPAINAENYIQNSNSYSQSLSSSKSGLIFSIVFDNTTGQTFAAGEVVFVWQYFAVGTALQNYATGGLRIGIGSSTSAWNSYDSGGSDFGRNPYGGWMNVAVDPTLSADDTVGGGNGGTYRYFGSVLNTSAVISKGEPHAVDAIRYGRGEIYCTSTGCTFTGMATKNDANDGTAGYNRWGLFQEQGGIYLWKGLLSIGQSGTSATFSDSNRTILIDDTPKTYAAFNKIEINHASSSVTWTNISFLATNASGLSPGSFEMIDDATVAMNKCQFTDMTTFIFDSNATITDTTFRRCGQVTQAGGTFDTCVFEESDAAVSLLSTADDIDLVTDCTFTSDGSNHAVNLGTVATSTAMNWDNYTASYAGSDGSTGNEAILVSVSASQTLTINVGDGYSTPYVYNTGAGDFVRVIAPKITKFTVQNAAQVDIENARVFVETGDDGGTGFPYKDAVTSLTQTGGTATLTATAVHGLVTGDKVVVRGAQPDGYNKVAQITVTSTTVFTYTVDSGLGAETGTPVFSYVPIHGLTDSNGEIQSSKSWPASQSLIGWVRKSTSSPYYKQTNIAVADASGGTDQLITLSLDE